MTEFYRHTAAERIALTKNAIEQQSTLLSRWQALGSGEADLWSPRAAAAAAWLVPYRSVADIGCGTMLLERYLSPDTQYIPVDVVRRDPRTLVCDLNAGALPDTSAEAFACLGLLEYLFDAKAILSVLNAQAYRGGVVSYNICESLSEHPDADGPISERRAHAWVNDFTLAEIESIFESSGWVIDQRSILDGAQRLWSLSRRAEVAQS